MELPQDSPLAEQLHDEAQPNQITEGSHQHHCPGTEQFHFLTQRRFQQNRTHLQSPELQNSVPGQVLADPRATTGVVEFSSSRTVWWELGKEQSWQVQSIFLQYWMREFCIQNQLKTEVRLPSSCINSSMLGQKQQWQHLKKICKH